MKRKWIGSLVFMLLIVGWLASLVWLGMRFDRTDDASVINPLFFILAPIVLSNIYELGFRWFGSIAGYTYVPEKGARGRKWIKLCHPWGNYLMEPPQGHPHVLYLLGGVLSVALGAALLAVLIRLANPGADAGLIFGYFCAMLGVVLILIQGEYRRLWGLRHDPAQAKIDECYTRVLVALARGARLSEISEELFVLRFDADWPSSTHCCLAFLWTLRLAIMGNLSDARELAEKIRGTSLPSYEHKAIRTLLDVDRMVNSNAPGFDQQMRDHLTYNLQTGAATLDELLWLYALWTHRKPQPGDAERVLCKLREALTQAPYPGLAEDALEAAHAIASMQKADGDEPSSSAGAAG